MAKIINEIPDELLDEEEVEVKASEADKVAQEQNTGDVEIPEEAPKQPKKEAEPVQGELDFDIEIEDDTPKADRNRQPLPDEVKEELDADTLDDYSDRVKNRMAQLKKARMMKDVQKKQQTAKELKLQELPNKLCQRIESLKKHFQQERQII